jgi:hypothetical protein
MKLLIQLLNLNFIVILMIFKLLLIINESIIMILKEQDLFKSKLYIIVQGKNKAQAAGKLKAFFNNFTVFKNYPLNEFNLKIH